MNITRYIFVLLCCFIFSCTDNADQLPWKAGTARTSITPETPVWLAGYGWKRVPEGVLHDLWVKALALEDTNGHHAVVVTSDLMGIPKYMYENISQKLMEKYQLDRSQIMLTFSHNHCSPRLSEDLVDYYPEDSTQTILVKEYSDQLEIKIIETVAKAFKNLSPARMYIGEGKANFAVNRRNNSEPEVAKLLADGIPLKGPVDHSVPVMAIYKANGRLETILFGYACHPTTLNFLKWCGDYPGFAQIDLEKNHPGTTALFFTGCGADQNPLPRREVSLCQKYGKQLAVAVEKTLEHPLKRIPADLRTAFEFVDLDYLAPITRAELEEAIQDTSQQNRARLRARWAKRMLNKLETGEKFAPSYPYPVQVWRLGGILNWISLGGEAVVDYALRFKKTFGADTWVCGYANYLVAYIPSYRVYQEGGYEGGAFVYEYGHPADRWAGDVEQRVVAAVEKLVGKVTSESDSLSGNIDQRTVNDRKWWQKPIRMMRRDYLSKFDNFINSDLGMLANETRNTWHCNAEWIMGSLGCSPGLADIITFNAPGFEKLATLGERDILREYIPLAHANGMHILSYLNMHWFSYRFAKKHPGWEQLVSTGESYGRLRPLYGNGTTMCVNSPWRDWAFKLIIETAKTGVDGIFLDGPVVYPGCCYCETCQRLFQQQTGAEIPKMEDWSNPLWKKFIAFREESMVNFLRDARKALHSVNPMTIIYLNGGKWRNEVARSPQQLQEYQDITGAEAFFHPGPRAEDLLTTLITAKFLSAGRNPAMVFSCHGMNPWHYIPLAPLEMKLAIAQTVAGGANPWFAIFDYALQYGKEEALAGVAEIQEFLEKNEEIFTGEVSLARVALWSSEQTSRYYVSHESMFMQDFGSGREENLIADLKKGKITVDWPQVKRKSADWVDAEINGYFNALSRAHIPVDFLWDSNITAERLKQYDVLILPNVACVSKLQRFAIREFVASGGTLIADFECGRFDEFGEQIYDADWMAFLGLEKIVGAFKPSVIEDYIRIIADEPINAGFHEGQLLARPQYILKVRPKSGALVPLVVLEPIGLSYQELSSDSDYPAVVTSQYGQGRVVYLSALEGEFYQSRKMAQHQTLIANAVYSAKRNPQKIILDAPATVHMEVRSKDQGKSLHIHLVNNTGDMQRPIGEFIPLQNVEISIKDVSGDPAARSLWLQQDLLVNLDDHNAIMTLPVIDYYDVVVVEFK